MRSVSPASAAAARGTAATAATVAASAKAKELATAASLRQQRIGHAALITRVGRGRLDHAGGDRVTFLQHVAGDRHVRPAADADAHRDRRQLSGDDGPHLTRSIATHTGCATAEPERALAAVPRVVTTPTAAATGCAALASAARASVALGEVPTTTADVAATATKATATATPAATAAACGEERLTFLRCHLL